MIADDIKDLEETLLKLKSIKNKTFIEIEDIKEESILMKEFLKVNLIF